MSEVVTGGQIVDRANEICDRLNEVDMPRDSKTCYGLTCVAVSMVADGALSPELFDEAMRLLIHHIAEYAADIRNQVVMRTQNDTTGTTTFH
jgi:hypothetical protein